MAISLSIFRFMASDDLLGIFIHSVVYLQLQQLEVLFNDVKHVTPVFDTRNPINDKKKHVLCA